MNTWLLVDYGGVLADDNVTAGEDELSNALGAPIDAIRLAISESSSNGRALRLDKLSESEFWQAVASEVCPRDRLIPAPDQLTRYWANCYAIRQDVAEVLWEAKANGISLGIATNVDRYREQHLLAALDRYSLTLRVWPSYNVGFMKPDTRYYEQIEKDISSFGSHSNCLYVDDRQSHVDAALSLGWRALKADRADLIRIWIHKQAFPK